MSNLIESKPKVIATAAIWGGAVTMLALCIPIVAISENPYIPLAVILGASGSSAAVWISADQKQKQGSQAPLAAELTQLADRVANLEVIATHNEDAIQSLRIKTQNDTLNLKR